MNLIHLQGFLFIMNQEFEEILWSNHIDTQNHEKIPETEEWKMKETETSPLMVVLMPQLPTVVSCISLYQ